MVPWVQNSPKVWVFEAETQRIMSMRYQYSSEYTKHMGFPEPNLIKFRFSLTYITPQQLMEKLC